MDSIHGIVKKIRYQNDTGFAIFEVQLRHHHRYANEQNRIIVLGTIANLAVGNEYTIIGEFVMHPKYGLQMRLDSYQKYPMDADDYRDPHIVEFVDHLRNGLGEKLGIDPERVKAFIAEYDAKTRSVG